MSKTTIRRFLGDGLYAEIVPNEDNTGVSFMWLDRPSTGRVSVSRNNIDELAELIKIIKEGEELF